MTAKKMSHNLRTSENNDYGLKVLLAELRKTIELYFFTQEQQQQQRRSNDDSNVSSSSSDENCKPFIDACLGILEHGLVVKQAVDAGDVWRRCSNNDAAASSSSTSTQPQTIDATQLQKFTEDFEWLYTITQLRQNRTQSHSTYDKLRAKHRSTAASATTSSSIHDFLYAWLWQSFETKSLCACLQALIADKELIELYYVESAFLQSDAYTNALCICVAAMELQQFNLLSQIDSELYQMAAALKHQKRTGSHPNLSFPEDKSGEVKPMQPYHSSDHNHKLELPPKCTQPTVPIVRKAKSLPLMPSTWLMTTPVARPRCKTLGTIGLTRRGRTKPRTIPLTISTAMTSTASSSSFSQDELDMRPSTSNNSRSLLSPSGSHASSLNSTITARNIEIINCDNIKIWTDQSAEPTSSSGGSTSSPTGSSIRSSNLLLPPKAIGVKQAKSMSPLNSFFANLFGTPPTYTSWSPQHGGHDTQSDTLDLLNTPSAFPCNKQSSSPLSTSVFDAFLPTYGKKLRSRKSQNLFDENGISTLDYNSTNQDKTSPLWMPQAEEAIPNEEQQHQQSGESKPKSTQTLSDYLKRSHLSRNNTDLEKENAHFTISEAIITAMEHIKWAKTAPDKRRRLEDKNTTTATDWLEKEHNTKANPARSHSASRELTGELAEHIPYAELGCFDELSAEIIGLTLISKFNDQQLPKVSELKWLVADEDTPQKLLPMPDETPSANPDEHVTPSMTRGTRYWAPPRQQIIFTDHSAHSRRELIKKQNYRCSGCGMRISPQNMHSFRYCTYFGKYHCTGCHRNQMSATPAKILQSWDFKCYPVSVFAYRLLDQMFTYPLFYVPDLNPALYTQTKVLHVARQKRRQLNFIKDFIRLCRFAQREQQYFQQIPNYISDDPDLWSMSDFIDVQDRSMKRSIEDLIAKCENHIHNCVLCTARGFYCEHCRKDHVIYPWENKVFRCDRCGSCYHMNCWRSIAEICYKCQRLNRRQAQEQFP